MLCEIYNSAYATHYTDVIGHVAENGNIYNSRTESLGNCVGHIAADGSVYAAPQGVSAGLGSCVGHINRDGNIYSVPPQSAPGIAYCAGHLEPDGTVYTTPAGTSAGVHHCVGRIEGGCPVYGAAALLLLLRNNASGGSYKAADDRPAKVQTYYDTPAHMLRALLFHAVVFGLLGYAAGWLLTNGDPVLPVLIGLCVGPAAALFLVIGLQFSKPKFDPGTCGNALVRLLYSDRLAVPLGIVLPAVLMVVAVLAALVGFTGGAALAVALLAVAAAAGVGVLLGVLLRPLFGRSRRK